MPDDFFTWLKNKYGYAEAKRRYEAWKATSKNMKRDEDNEYNEDNEHNKKRGGQQKLA